MISRFIKYYILIILFLSFSLRVEAQDTTVRSASIDSTVIKAEMRSFSRGNKIIISPAVSNQLVNVIGVNDILKAISIRPGVSSGMEGSVANYVRGAGNGGNRIELSGVPLYRSSHLLGLTSSLPSEMISSMAFHTGGLKASSGNATSSLTEIELKSDIAKRVSGIVSVSPFMEELFLEAPIGRNFTARISGRFSPAFSIANTVVKHYAKSGESLDINEIDGSAYDLLSSVVWAPSKRVIFDAYFFKSHDSFNYSFSSGDEDLSAGEKAGKIGFKVNLGRTGSFEGQLYRTESQTWHNEDFITKVSEQFDNRKSHLSIKSFNKESGFKFLYNIDLFSFLSAQIGVEQTQRTMEYESMSSVTDMNSAYSNTKYTLKSAFAEAELKTDRIKVLISTRPSKYSFKKRDEKRQDSFFNADFHVLSDIYVLKDKGFEFSYDKALQFFHVLEGLPSGWNQDMMMACDTSFPEEAMKQFYFGFFGKDSFGEGTTLSYSAGYFNREMNGLLSFRHAAYIFGIHDNLGLDEIVTGNGKSHGIEASVSILSSRWNAELSYTHSKSTRLFPELNFGKEFNFRFDRPDIFNFQSDIILKRTKTAKSTTEHRLDFLVSYSSGNLMTAPQGTYSIPFPGHEIPNGENVIIEDIAQLNNFRMPDYFRIDTGYTYSYKSPRFSIDITASVFNLLNRHNAYQYYYEDGVWKQLSILPIMPSLRVSCKL